MTAPGRTLIVSASDTGFFSLLDGLLRSILPDARRDSMDIGVLDLGFDDGQRSALSERGVILRKPDWDYDPGIFRTAPPPFFKAMTARPHLPKYFPGYDLYLWLDADCWVQDWQAIRLYVEAATKLGFAATPELDRSYSPFYATETVAGWARHCFSTCFTPELAKTLAEFPVINCGAFAARADSPLWSSWSSLLGKVLKALGEPFFFAEQTVLNALIRNRQIPIAQLPSRCNWVCNRALPVSRDGDGILCHPEYPHEKLGVIHLTATTKDGTKTLKTVEGSTIERSLRFGQMSLIKVMIDETNNAGL